MKRWQQYGIAISVAWILGVASYQRYQELPKAKEYATHAYFVCTEQKAAAGEKDIDPCLENVSRDWDEWMNRSWGKIAWLALVPVAVGWLACLVGLFAYRRWVK
jgi:hypothetical protein